MLDDVLRYIDDICNCHLKREKKVSFYALPNLICSNVNTITNITNSKLRLLFLVLSTYTRPYFTSHYILQIPFSACKGGLLPSYRSSFLLWKKCLEVISSSLSGQKYHKED